MTLRQIFLRLFGTLTLLSAALAVSSLYAASEIRGDTAEVADAFEQVRLSEELQIHELGTNRAWLLFRLTGREEHAIAWADEEQKIQETLDELERLAEPRDAAALAEAERAAKTYLEKRGEIGPLAESFAAGGQGAYEEAANLLGDAHRAAADLTHANLDQAAASLTAARRSAVHVSAVATVFLAASGILLPAAAWSARRWIYLPTRALGERIAGFREGHALADVKPSGVAELRVISDAFEELTWRLADQRRVRLRFLAGVAHDLKNPLAGIKLSAQLLGRDPGTPDARARLIGAITRQSDQMQRMIGDFLDASSIESGNLDLACSAQDLRRLAQDAVALHRPVAERHTISLRTPDEPVTCWCDPTRVTQVLNNLLSNAIKYAPEGGRIDVRVDVEGPCAVVRVSDEGIGIAEADLDEVFEPFRRTRLTKATIPGVGLGLSVSKRIVERHGGTIAVESQLGVGSTFTVRLPLGDAAPEA